MFTVDHTHTVHNAIDIPYITAQEAFTLLSTEFERFLKLMAALNDADWVKPTACTAWSVRDILAHQAGGYASGTGYREMIRQYSSQRKPGQLPEDAINDLQVSERAGRSPAELAAELRLVGPIAIQNWAFHFRVPKLITNLIKVPHPVSGAMSVQHLMWVIHSRDTWMHRLDICRATERHFEQTAEHDGRIAALVMRDVGQALAPKLNGGAMIFELGGAAGGKWQVGSGVAVATLRMDVLDFNVFASGRFTAEEALARAEVEGDRGLVEKTLKELLILF